MASPITRKTFNQLTSYQLNKIFNEVYTENGWGTYTPDDHEIEVNFDDTTPVQITVDNGRN